MTKGSSWKRKEMIWDFWNIRKEERKERNMDKYNSHEFSKLCLEAKFLILSDVVLDVHRGNISESYIINKRG